MPSCVYDGMTLTIGDLVYSMSDGEALIVGEQAEIMSRIDPGNLHWLSHPSEWNFTEIESDIWLVPCLTKAACAVQILRELAKRAEATGHPVRKVVLTCPFWYTKQERYMLKMAAREAGLFPLDVIDEHLAAAKRIYHEDRNTSKHVLVVELGASALRISVLHLAIKAHQHVCAMHDCRLKSDFWVTRMQSLLLDKLAEQGVRAGEWMSDGYCRQELRFLAEKAIERLEKHDSACVTACMGTQDYALFVSREEYAARTQDLLQLIQAHTHKILARIKCSSPHLNLDSYLLLGASARVPGIREALSNCILRHYPNTSDSILLIPNTPHCLELPCAISQGAALHGMSLPELLHPPVPQRKREITRARKITRNIYGIDLGSTYSAISVITPDGKPEILCNTDGLQLTASAVYFESPDNIVVGEAALEQGWIDAERVVEFIKRKMGTDWCREFDGREYTPEGISAIILRYLVKGAEQAGHKVEDVVITCPPYFGEKERNATRLAGEIAGLNVLAIIDEPIAAARNYGITPEEEDKCILVYDLGGCTFDVTVLRTNNGRVYLAWSDGNHMLGGAEWNLCLEKLITDKFIEACPGAGNPQDAPELRYELCFQAEKVKRKLSNASECKAVVSYDAERTRMRITREEFENATRHLLDETLRITDEVIENVRQQLGIVKFDEFLLVGGSTYMSQVRDAIEDRYAEALGVEPKIFEPNYAVSKGAALYGASLCNSAPDEDDLNVVY